MSKGIIFISYKSSDDKLVSPVYEALQSRGIDVFMASKDISPLDLWPAVIANGIDKSSLFISFVSEAYLNDYYQVSKEIRYADDKKIDIFFILYRTEFSQIPKDWQYHTGRQGLKITEINEESINKIVDLCIKFIDNGRVMIASPEEILKEADDLFKNKDYSGALSIYEKLSSECPQVYTKIVLCKILLKQYPSARESAKELQILLPNQADTFFYSAMSNLAGRTEYSTKLLERTKELLEKAWRIKPCLDHCYLAFCLAKIFERYSYSIPKSIIEMVDNGRPKMEISCLYAYIEMLGVSFHS